MFHKTLEFLQQSALWHPGYLWQAHSPSSIWELLHSICCTESYRKRVLALHHFLSGGAFLHSFFPCFFPFLLQRECLRKGTLLGTRGTFVTFVPERIPGLERRMCHLHQEFSQDVEKHARKNQLKLIILLLFSPSFKKWSFTSLKRRHTKSSVKSC